MKTRDEIRSVILNHQKELREKFKVKKVGIFGSYAKVLT